MRTDAWLCEEGTTLAEGGQLGPSKLEERQELAGSVAAELATSHVLRLAKGLALVDGQG